MIGYFPLAGGDDLTTSKLAVDPGRLLVSRNYECDKNGKYHRIDGYERFDGQPKPSEATYWVLDFDAGEGEISVGNIVAGATSTASGEVLVVTVESGAWGTSDAAGYLVLFNISGYFEDDEDIEVSAVKKAVADGTAVKGTSSDDNYDTWIQAAIEATRTDIAAVPGSGPILGIWQYNGVKYAFRNDSGVTKTAMYKSTTSGWSLCDLGESIAFTSGGTYEVVVDNTITGATSGATAVVKKILLSSGSWAGGDAAGTFILYSQSGTFQSENLNVGANSNVATIAGNSTENTMAYASTQIAYIGTKFEFVNYNFGGHAGTYKMYGCYGGGKAFEWDGSVFVPITTGMTTDKPIHIIAHERHLFLAFSGGSVQHSSIGDPYTWSVVTGASEIGMGDEITGFMSMPKALAIFTRSATKILYGSSSDDWELRTLSEESGAIEWTAKKLGNNCVVMSDKGVTTLAAVQEYGDFSNSVISDAFDPIVKKDIYAVTSIIKTTPCTVHPDCASGYICSGGWCVKVPYMDAITVKEKSQYRFFTNIGTAFYLTLGRGNKILGFTRVELSDTVACCYSTEDSNGNEELFFGSTDGMVYQLDKGTSFDGDAIKAYIKTHYNHFKTPKNKKRFRSVTLEVDAEEAFTLSLRPEFSYGDKYDYSESFPNLANWTSDSWSDIAWDAESVTDGAKFYIDGSGVNMSLDIYTSLTYEAPHTLNGILVDYEIRGIDR